MPIAARESWESSPYRKSEKRFDEAMKGLSYGTKPAATPKARRPDPPGLLLGELEGDAGAIALDLARLLEGRLLVQGVSGAGKSWLIRRLCEQAAGQVQQIVIDPEGEFATLAIELGILHVPGHRLDPAALRRLALRCREHRTSLVLDLSDCDRTGQMIAVAPFLEGLVDVAKEHWHPCLVAIDEAHLFAPFGGHSTADTSVRKAAIGAVVDLMSRGRKRGLAGVLATQRLARLSKSVTSEISNFLIGLNSQDLDIRRAAEQIGWDSRKGFDRLPLLQPGEFVAVGRVFSTQPAQLKVGAVKSEHRGATPAIAPAPLIDPGESSKLLDLEELLAQSAEDAGIIDETRQSRGMQAVRGFIRDPDFAVAAAVFGALRAVRPNGVRSVDLAQHLKVTVDDIGRAVGLLDSYGVLEFGAAGAAGPIAIDRKFLAKDAAP